MKIKNPTDKDLKVTIFGTTYELEADGELCGISKRAAGYWKNKLHNFLVVEEEDTEKLEKLEIATPAKEEETTKEVVEEKTEEVEVDLVELKRPQLDEIAEKNGLKPSDYKTKEEVIDALMSIE